MKIRENLREVLIHPPYSPSCQTTFVSVFGEFS